MKDKKKNQTQEKPGVQKKSLGTVRKKAVGVTSTPHEKRVRRTKPKTAKNSPPKNIQSPRTPLIKTVAARRRFLREGLSSSPPVLAPMVSRQQRRRGIAAGALLLCFVFSGNHHSAFTEQ